MVLPRTKRASYNISGNSPLYSFDESKTCTVTFQERDGTVLETRSVAEGSYAAPPDGLEIPQGYEFSGWEGNYCDVRQDETVTAVYTPVPYTITYELGEGTNPLSNVEEYTVETALRLEAPSKTGYDFEGWYTDAEYREQVTAIEQGTTGDVVLYAKWSPAQYKITYELRTMQPIPRSTPSRQTQSVWQRPDGQGMYLTAGLRIRRIWLRWRIFLRAVQATCACMQTGR